LLRRIAEEFQDTLAPDLCGCLPEVSATHAVTRRRTGARCKAVWIMEAMMIESEILHNFAYQF